MAALAALAPIVLPVRIIATAALALAIPIFLVASGVRWVALGESFYVEEFARYRVDTVTGLSRDELQRVAHAFVTYFEAEPGRMDVVVQTARGPEPLFSEREILHMVDVQALLRLISQAWTIALITMIIGSLLIIIVEPATGGPAVITAAAVGGGVSVVLIGLLGAASFLDFSRIFYQFHQLSFSNDLWLLDPSRDRLIQLFPTGFFFDAAIRIAVQTVVLGVVILAASVGALRSMR